MLVILGPELPAQNRRELLLDLGSRRAAVAMEQRSGKPYVSLKNMISALRLDGRESKGRLNLSGPGGELLFLDGRPLVRGGVDYLLMSAAAWRKGPSDWYIPEDFLIRALAPILPGRFSKTGAARYRFEPRDLNRVKVEVTNHPSHVRIEFTTSRPGPIRVHDRQGYVEVEFGPYRVRPGAKRGTASSRLVSSLRFNSRDPFGTYRIHKGQDYRRYRDVGASGASSRVVEIHGSMRRAPASASRAVPATAGSPDPVPARRSRLSTTRRPRERPVIVVDPGHGGSDSGGIWEGDLGEQGFVEKDLALQFALQLRDEFRKRGLEVVLTRDRDVNLSAARRSAVGNSNRTRAYLSLHLGRAPDAEMRGGVVYFHGKPPVMPPPEPEEPDEEPLALQDGETPDLPQPESETGEGEEEENDVEIVVSQVEPEPEPEEQGKFVLWEMGQERYQPRSRDLAAAVQESLNQAYEVENQVIEAPLTVLQSVAAAGIVVEFGQLTNAVDRLNLTLQPFQQRLISALAAGVVAFLEGPPDGSDPE
ncbi:MAG: N-acetylmuramoyl-L-alanine amidase [Candidatus Aminicenantes bacterium]|nr:N-acetylmuramoyl-L-alanine amidase [Candidatus Aminicenantes bacterium]